MIRKFIKVIKYHKFKGELDKLGGHEHRHRKNNEIVGENLMRDSYGRNINYLRISVTDRCNLRCVYCMPKQGIALKEHEDILRFEDTLKIVKIASKLGIKKIRYTGGEPLVMKDIDKLIYETSKLSRHRRYCNNYKWYFTY